jgi:hypothetical protein
MVESIRTYGYTIIAGYSVAATTIEDGLGRQPMLILIFEPMMTWNR